MKSVAPLKKSIPEALAYCEIAAVGGSAAAPAGPAVMTGGPRLKLVLMMVIDRREEQSVFRYKKLFYQV